MDEEETEMAPQYEEETINSPEPKDEASSSIDETPSDESTSDDSQSDETPSDDSPSDETPSDDLPSDDLPSDETSTDETPSDDFPTDDFPSDETSTDETPSDDFPTDDFPSDDFPSDDFPSDDFPSDETSTDETPSDDIQANTTDIFTNETEDTAFTNVTDNFTNNITDIFTNETEDTAFTNITDEINEEDPESRLNISISFRQVLGFKREAEEITFQFFGFSTEKLEKGYIIYLYLNLLLQGGKPNKEESRAQCVLKDDVDPEKGQYQADFDCSITEFDKTLVFTSFELIPKGGVGGFPDNKDLLNPVITLEYIASGRLLDYSKEENKNKLPLIFKPEYINGETCSQDGKIKIFGTLSTDLDKTLEFHLHFTSPKDKALCMIPKSPAGRIEVDCVVEGSFDWQQIFVEQQIIREGLTELLFEKVYSGGIKCKEGNVEDFNNEIKHQEEKEAQKLLDIHITFRQVNKFLFDHLKGLITFKFFALTTEFIPKGHKIFFFVKLILADGTKDSKESKAVCINPNDIHPNGQVQADFDCTIEDLDNSKNYTSFEITKSEGLAGGLPSDPTLLDPILTEKAIESGDLIDYGNEENKNKIPAMFNSESINGEDCSKEGKFTIIGSPVGEIEKDFEFKIELTFPYNNFADCTILKAKPSEIQCIIANEFKDESIMFEQHTIFDGLNEFLTFTNITSETLTCSKGELPLDPAYSDELTPTNPNDTSHEGPQNPDDSSNGEEHAISTGSKYDNDTQSDIPEEENKEMENADVRANISISFRQLNHFLYNSRKITYDFYSLVTKPLKAEYEITMNVNLMLISGERDVNATEITCTLEKEVNPSEGETLQGNFKCSIEGLEDEYYSFRFNSSDYIAGIPTEETLLDPMLTKEAIERGELLDYSLDGNKNKIPSIFTCSGIQATKCGENGNFIIEGKLNKEVTVDVKFTINLAYPEGISADCSLVKKEKGDSELSCQIDRDIDNKTIIFEQIVIKDGPDEVLLIGSYSSENTLNCANGLLLQAEEKINVNVSFRQVSHLEPKEGNKGFKFFLAAFISRKLPREFIIVKIIIVIGGNKQEKEAKCTIRNNIDPQDGQQVQGDFDCDVDMAEQIDLAKTEIKVSRENDEISGVSDLEEDQLSPNETDFNIKNSQNVENMTELEECIDYSVEENKNKIPPSLDIISIDEEKFKPDRGKLKIIGKFSEDVNEEIIFDLPLTFPLSSVKCKVTEAKKDEEVEFTCKVQSPFKLVKSFAIEKRMIKKRFKEVVLIKSKIIPFKKPHKMENYNVFKYNRAKEKQKMQFSFFNLGNFKPQGPRFGFFMGLMKKPSAPVFQPMTFTIIVKIQISITTNLRGLAQTKTEDEELPVSCTLDEKSTETTGGLNCNSNENAKGIPVGMEIDPDDDGLGVAGIPQNIDPSQQVNLNYNEEELQEVNITEIQSDDCSDKGTYTIIGNNVGEKDFDKTTKYEGVEIPFSSPDSSGLCDISINGKEVKMDCNNKEKFDISQVLFEQTIVKDKEGKAIFLLNSYSSLRSFGCAISPKSVPAKTESTPGGNSNANPSSSSASSSSKINSGEINRAIRKTGSSGLSGGAIAGIIIASIAVIAVALGLIILAKNGTFAAKPALDPNFGNNSTVNNFYAEPSPNEL